MPPGGMTGYAPPARVGTRLRVLSLRLMISRPFRGLAKKLFLSKADALDLPHYAVAVPEEH